MSKDFTHLHVHTEMSIQDGITKIPELCKHVKASGMSACAITDHGVLFGVIDFYKECRKVGINPLIGVEAYVTDDEDGIENNKDKTRDNNHCILLAQNKTGLRNLFWLTNMANQHNFYYRPRISIEHLRQGRAEGIIATSSCLGGVVSKHGEYDKAAGTFTDPNGTATKRLELFAELFPNRFYAEIQDNPEFWQQSVYNTWLLVRAAEISIPTVITSDAHFLTKDDKETHNLIMAKQMGKTVKEYVGDEDGMFYGEGHYIRTPEEMYQAALKYDAEEAFWNTTEIAKKCNVEIELGKYENPAFNIEKEDDYEEFQSWKTTEYECDPLLL